MSEAVPIAPVLSTLLAELRQASSFEAAAEVTLRVMLRLASQALEASSFASFGRIARAMLHLRPDDGYRQLVVLEAGADALSSHDATGTRLPSTTAWRWVAEHEGALSIDVHLGRVQLDGSPPGEGLPDRRFGEGELPGPESRGRLLQREISHLFVLPVRGPPGRVDGMISLEAECHEAMGRPFVWSTCSTALQLVADLASPYLAGLPVKLVRPQVADSYLPVVGAAMAPIVDLLRVFVKQNDPILLSGPTGVGKSRLARWCHENSAVRAGPFEMLDLSTLPEELQLAELFGWKRGAFTGAARDKRGVISRAKGGTLFLDEIDNLSPRAQAGLLHVLSERVYRVLGDDAVPVPADVRFVVGTNAWLQEAVREKRFREDLYFRINVLPVRLPPLRGRPDEIPVWAHYMANRQHAKSIAGGQVTLGAGVLKLLLGHPWPGNLRQLDNILRRSYAIAIMAYGESPPKDMVLEEEHLRRALACEATGDTSSLISALISAAAAFVGEVESGRSLDLDLADSFKGFVLGVAAEKLGDQDEAFKLLGREKVLAARNHHKVLRRELARVEALCAALGRDGEFPFTRVAGGHRALLE